jgi:acyl-coenzyme A synthetase/AMP-(fatty) acid ligase
MTGVKSESPGIGSPRALTADLGGQQGNSGSFVIFTSGSAGRPNGVVFPWSRAFEVVSGVSGYSAMPDGEVVVLNLQPLHWSVGLFHVLSASLGHTVATLDPMIMSASRLLKEISLASPTTVYLGANFARILGKALDLYKGGVLSSITRFAVGAGALRWEDLVPYKKLVPETATFLHTYGASEAIGMMAYSCGFGEVLPAGRVPLGEPRTVGGIRFVCTDEPAIFEVHASARIASGYLDRDITDQRFVRDDDGTVWWQSGDHVCLDGVSKQFFYHGRFDDLVKINDQRVSLVEIESVLRAFSSIDDAVVLAVHLGGRYRIVAFVQPIPGHKLVECALGLFVEQRLSVVSRPQLILPLPEIPYTSRYKPDSDRLRAIAGDAFR